MGDDWREEWVAHGIATVPRPFLPAALSDDPEAYRQLEEAARELVERLLAADPFMAGLQALLEADSMTALLQAARDHPILLMAEAEARIRQGAENARRAGQEEIARAMEERYRVLRQTVQAAQESGLTLEQALEMARLAAQMPPELLEILAELAAGGAEIRSPDDLERLLAERPDLREKLEQAVAGLTPPPIPSPLPPGGRGAGGEGIPPEFQADLRRAQEGVARYGQTGDLAALNQAIAAWERILNHPAFPRADERFRLAAWNGAAIALISRYQASGHLPDLDRAMALWQEAIARTPEGSPDWARWQANLGNALLTRFEALGQGADLDAAVEAYGKALAVAREGSPDWAKMQANLGNALRTRFEALGQVADLDAAIAAYGKALSVAREGSPDWASRQANLGNALRTRFEALGQGADLDAAIEAFRKALAVARQGSPDWAKWQANLGGALIRRFEALGQGADLDAAIEAYGKALAVAREGSPDWASRQANLGGALIRRFEALGQVADLDAAIAAYEKALAVAREGSPDWAKWQANLGVALRTRFEALGQGADLDAAIAAYEKALAVAREGSPDWARWQANLGVALWRRFEALGQVADLDAAIAAYEKALAVAREGSPDWAKWQNNLGLALSTRFEALGQGADLDAAIQAYGKALSVAREGSPDWAKWQANLGNALLTRFEALGQVADLDAAIAAFHKALSVAREGSPDWATMQANLGGALIRRFKALGQVADLDAAIAAYEKALAVFTPEAFPDYTLTAALPLIHLLMRRRGENDMERVAAAGARAVPAWQYLYFESLHESRKQRHLRRAQGLWANYAFALARLGRAEEAVAVLETGRARQLAETFRARQALETLQSPALAGAWRAVKEAESRYHHAPEAKRPAAEADLARRRQEYYARLREHFPDYFAEPTFADVQAALTPPPAPSPLPRSGRGEGIGGWGEAPALVYLLATPAGGLALVVTAAGVQAVDLPDLTEAALNGWLVKTDEAGQNVIGGYLPAQLAVSAWMSDALEDLLPALGRALQPLVEALTPSPQPPSPLPNLGEGKGVLPQVAGVGVRAITLIPTGRLALLPLHAARLPDGSHLLDHFAISYTPSAQALQAARREAEARQEAPFFLAGVGNPLPSPEALTDLHRELQEAVAALPEQERIRLLRQELLRLTELPTAQLRHEGFLLRRLILRLPEDLGEPVQRLLDLSHRWPLSLRYARAELQSVVDLLPPEAADPLYEQEATLRALLERLPRATTVHFSCHGVFQADDPLQSGLLLVDEEGKEARLTLRDLFAGESTALRAARLVVLSACQTAVSDFRNLPEEAIGLPAGFLQAGVPAVIGTLWSVDDAATALLVTRTYEYMLQERLSPPQAVRQAQVWLRDLTNADLEAYLTHHEAIARARLESGRRMPFTLLEELLVKVITTGDPQARPYADPYFWAPFTFTGAGEVR